MHNIIYRLFTNISMDLQHSLTKNAVSRMLDIHKGVRESFIVQVSNFKEVPREKYLKLHIFDGTTNIKAIMEVKKEDDDLRLLAKKYGKKAAFTIEITEHVTHSFEGNKVLEIMSFLPCEVPQPTFSEPILPLKQQTKKIEEVHQPTLIEPMKVQPAIQANPLTSKTVIQESDLRQFQRISDLYSDFQGWRIAVRVLDTCYKEFNSKSGKLTKIFTMFLTDRYGQKIEAAMFGDDAKDYHNAILMNQVYVISRGQIKESTYSHLRTENQSRYIIILTRNSEISRIQDLKEIPKAMEATMTIPLVVSDLNFDKQYEIVAILLQVGEEKTIEKEEGKIIYKRSLIIGDPEKRKSMEAIVWGRNIIIPENITGKTIILKHFRLNRYRDMLSLCSTFKSQLIRKQKHRFNTYQGSQIEYQSISNSKETHKQVHETSIYKSIRDLENELNYIGPHQAIFSDLQFWVTFINFKNKWYYEACNNPKCKKQTQHRSKCIHCGTFNEDILKKFILPIEITDFTGSLWTTAFDDFANEIFKDCKLELLAKLPDAQLKEEGEKRLYQQYKGRISTRRTEDGIIRHTIMGKPCELQIEKAMLSNIEKIKNALY